MLNAHQENLCTENTLNFSDLRAVFVNASLKREAGDSHTSPLLGVPAEIMHRNGVAAEEIHMLSHQVPPGVYPTAPALS